MVSADQTEENDATFFHEESTDNAHKILFKQTMGEYQGSTVTNPVIYQLKEENLQELPDDQQQTTGLPYGYFRKQR